MTSKLRLLAIFALLSYIVQSIVADEALVVVGSNNDSIAALSDIGSTRQAEVQCSYFQEIVDGVYANKSENFSKVLQFAEYSSNVNFKADVLIALYNAMNDVHHTEDPLRAILLYDEIEALINANSSDLHSYQLYQLEVIRYRLFLIIRDNGADVLEAAVYLNKCNHENTTVGHLLDLLSESNETLSDATISQMVHKAHWVVAEEELLQTLGNLSTHVSQNVEAMLAFYNVQQIQGDFQIDFFIQLSKLQEDPDYNSTVSAEKQHRVNEIFPIPFQTLLGGDVCLSQSMSNGSRFYIQECKPSMRACIYIYASPKYETAFKVQLNRTTNGFSFQSGYWGNRTLVILYGGDREQVGGLTLNVYKTSIISVDNNWKIKLDDDQVILQNMNGTRLLCAGNELALEGYQWFAYTRDAANSTLYSNECKWSVDNCANSTLTTKL